MEIKKESPYLPKSNLKYLVSSFRTNIAYRVWKRKLYRYGGLTVNSSFKLLEVGCGPGYFLKWAQNQFPRAEINGLDIDESLVEFAKKNVNNAIVSRYGGQKLPFPNENFDVVCALQVIEHLQKPEYFFTEAYRVLKEKGLLIISTPNPAGLCARVLGHRWHGFRYDHISLKTPCQWSTLIKGSGFQILDD